MLQWLYVHLGLSDASGAWYLFWSGFEGDLQQLTILGGVGLWYRHRKCVSCWRISKHVVEGTAWRTCHHHLTRDSHTRLLGEYRSKHPDQHQMLESPDADSDKLDIP